MGLYSKIIDLQKLGQAWERVKRNKPAAGVDHVTYEMFDSTCKEELKQLNIELAEHRYKSLPVKLSNLYKGEKVRQIALFSMRDKVVHQSIAGELNKLYEPLFSPCATAYRQGKSALEAVRKIEERLNTTKEIWVLKLDIADFFDSIRLDLLYEFLRRKIREEDVLDLIAASLQAQVFDEKTGELKRKERGIYQGASCAPVLSNIYLMDYDAEMESRSSFYIRYSDDILIIDSNEEKIKILLEYTKRCFEKLGLRLKQDKIYLRYLDEKESFTYLGYDFSRCGKSIPAKAIASLSERLETMWFSSDLKWEEKLQKGQEILGGWEQYYREERKPDSIIEYVILLSMVQRKTPEIIEKLENQRFQLKNFYKDIACHMVQYWSEKGKSENVLMEYEQFYQVPEDKAKKIEPADKTLKELVVNYGKLMIHSDENLYLEIMQLYTDRGEYKKAAHFWDLKAKCGGKEEISIPETDVVNLGLSDEASLQISIQNYIDLFAGREDTYTKEILKNGKHQIMEHVMELLTEEIIRLHLDGKITAGTYVQRPNGTSKYMIFDVDISKRILLQFPYGSQEFSAYKQKAAEYTRILCRTLKSMGISGYIEDTGYRGYHIWVFFTEWIPIRYIHQLAEYAQKETNAQEDILLEIFPNNIRIRQGKYGQVLRLPLGIHTITGNRSFFVNEEFQRIINYKEFLMQVARHTLTTVRKILGMHSDVAEEKITLKEVDNHLERFGTLPESVKLVLEKCNLMRYLCQKAVTIGYLSHFERMSVLYVFGHMGDEGKEFVHTVMGFTLNYQYNTTQKFILKLPEKPVSCIKLRDQYKMITAEYGCSCNFKRTKNCYPSPVLHALKNSDEEQSDITVPVSRALSKGKEENVYEEINIHKQTEKLAQRIVELKKQKRGLEKTIHKIETELQAIFDQASIDCLEIGMGLLVRRRKGEAYEWLIEL